MNENEIVQQFERYSNLLRKLFDPDRVDAFVDHYGERLALCPMGLTLDEGGYPGALVRFHLNMANAAKMLIQKAELDIQARSLVRCAAVCDLGRLGDLSEGTDLYIEQTSDWHREKLGQHYKYNDGCTKSSVSHRTLHILQHFGLQLTQEEWITVLTSSGLHLPENAFYGNKKNDLMDAFQLSKHLVLKSINSKESKK